MFNPVTGVGQRAGPARWSSAGTPTAGVVGEATLGVAYEGPPGFVHGGMSALLMDQMLGSAAAAAGVWGMTAHLELDYRGPLPLETKLVLRARVAESSGRKSVITGTIALAEDPDRSSSRRAACSSCPARRRSRPTSASITDASGRHTPPRRPSDATALEQS